MANIIKNLGWFHVDHTSLALAASAILAFVLIAAFAAAIGLRQTRKPALALARNPMQGTSAAETLELDGQEAEQRESKSRLHRRASIIGRRFRKSRRIRDNLLFFSSFAKAPRNVGSITPSGRGLGRAMAAELPGEYSVCVELGGGTGSLTSAILAAGVPSDKLIVVERDPRLAAHLRKRFGKVKVVEGDAQHLRRILADAGVDHVDAVVSGLPLRNLPGAVRLNIANEVFAALEPGGVFVQFTYWGEPPVPAEVVQRCSTGGRMTRRVWRNMPPANVWRYERRADAG